MKASFATIGWLQIIDAWITLTVGLLVLFCFVYYNRRCFVIYNRFRMVVSGISETPVKGAHLGNSRLSSLVTLACLSTICVLASSVRLTSYMLTSSPGDLIPVLLSVAGSPLLGDQI